MITGVMSVGVTPNSGKDQEWRQEVGWGYPGILAGEAPPEEEAPTGSVRQNLMSQIQLGFFMALRTLGF